jgi:activator of 2-hydroxyglutaryl-CoA dehydratase
VVTLINSGVDQADIAAGLVDSIARRLIAMIYRIGLTQDLVFTGGCAKNGALISGLEKIMGESIVRLPDPQIVGALGAAIFAREKALKKTEETFHPD